MDFSEADTASQREKTSWFSLNRSTGLIHSPIRDVPLCVFVSVCATSCDLEKNILLPFTKVESPINHLQKESAGKIKDMILVSDLKYL